MYKRACVIVDLKVFHDACIIFLHTCNSSLYFTLVFFVVYRGPHGRLAAFARCVTL